MGKMIAMCGLDCNDCIAFIAAQKNDDDLRKKVVEAWSTPEERLELDDVDCDGCTAGKRLHSFCQVCDVRKCGLKKRIINCSLCNEFPCEKLKKLWRSFSTVSGEEAKANLVKIKQNSSKK
jgi:hypothetical protein